MQVVQEIFDWSAHFYATFHLCRALYVCEFMCVFMVDVYVCVAARQAYYITLYVVLLSATAMSQP